MNKNAFTLIELMVVITIFWIVMVSVFQIFFISSDLSYKIDINRQMQENIKNLTETIAEDIRKNWIKWVSNEDDLWSNYDQTSWEWLKLTNGNKYYISNNKESLGRLFDINECSQLDKNCFLVKNDWSPSRLTNSWVAFEDLEFNILWSEKKKLVINFIMRPSSKKWIKAKLIKDSKLIFETTLSERFVKTN